MIVHVVLFKWREGADAGAIAAAMEGLRALKDLIPGVLYLSCGENFSPRSQGFHCALVIRFADRAALDAYSPHPAHQEVVTCLLDPIRIDTIAVDYAITSS